MKTKIIFITGYTAIWLALFSGCSSNNSSDPLGNCNGSGIGWTKMIETELGAFHEAATAYYNDPGAETCEVFKNGIGDYLDALKAAEACVPASEEQAYREAIAEAEEELSQVDCSQEP